MFLVSILFLFLFTYVFFVNGHVRWFAEFKFGPFFILGAACYYIFIEKDRTPATIGVAVLAFVFSIAYLLSHRGFGYAGFKQIDSLRITTAAAFALMMFVLVGMTQIKVGPTLSKIDQTLGNLTYPLYLIHPTIIALALRTPDLSGGAHVLLLYLICVVTAYCIFHVVERPVASMRVHFRGRSIG